MAEIEIVEKDYAFGEDLLGDYDDRGIIELINKRIDAIREQMATGVAARMQKVLEDIVKHTTVEQVGKDIHIHFWDSSRTLFAWKIIPEAEIEIEEDEGEAP